STHTVTAGTSPSTCATYHRRRSPRPRLERSAVDARVQERAYGPAAGAGGGLSRGHNVLAHPQRVEAELLCERANPARSVRARARAHVCAKEPERRHRLSSSAGIAIRTVG